MWQPTASVKFLQLRAQLLTDIRRFFAERKVLEVETPLLCQHTITASFIDSFHVDERFLQTSPEYAMKRLLAAGSGAIYQICKAFRQSDVSKKHNPEFTLLEWYRPGFNHHELMADLDELLQQVAHTKPAHKIAYQQLFEDHLNMNPHTATTEHLAEIARQQNILIAADAHFTATTWLELLFTHCIEPTLGFTAPTFIYDFPAAQAALAKIRHDRYPVAERFEVYIRGVELANGFHELTDANEQYRRFQQDNAQRKGLGKPEMTIDSYFIAALNAGLPNCAGVALGIDRLLMLLADTSKISDVIAFNWHNS